jgi:ribosomal protein S27E
MRANGVRSLDVQCWQCRHKTIINADHWPGDLTVKSFEPRMVCTKCGTIGADVRSKGESGRGLNAASETRCRQ